MNYNMTEYELFDILLNYASLYENRLEFFISATVAMVVATFISAGKLNIFLRSFVIIIYTAFCISQYQAMSNIAFKANQIVKSIDLVSNHNNLNLPITDAILSNPLNALSDLVFYVLVLAWAGCILLMAFPRLMKLNK